MENSTKHSESSLEAAMVVSRSMNLTSGCHPTLPFAHLNLRRNPFGELSPAERMDVAVSDVSEFVEALREPGFAVQFLGDQGRGKTTHLLSIWRHFRDSPYLRIGEGERPPIPIGDPLLLDEVQRISRWTRRRVFRRNISLAIGSHEDHEAELRRAGKRVVTVEVAKLMAAPRLQAILQRRIDAVRRVEGPIPRIKKQTVESLIAQFGSDIRGMEGQLYEVFQQLEEVCDV
ncbi:MAG: hypothetical protein ACI9G1_000668 [Pirellulaceae bacterium]